MTERRYCNKPDRHVPSLTCGFPLPCPYHTVIVDQETGKIDYPSDVDNETKKKVEQIREVIEKI